MVKGLGFKVRVWGLRSISEGPYTLPFWKVPKDHPYILWFLGPSSIMVA